MDKKNLQQYNHALFHNMMRFLDGVCEINLLDGTAVLSESVLNPQFKGRRFIYDDMITELICTKAANEDQNRYLKMLSLDSLKKINNECEWDIKLRDTNEVYKIFRFFITPLYNEADIISHIYVAYRIIEPSADSSTDSDVMAACHAESITKQHNNILCYRKEMEKAHEETQLLLYSLQLMKDSYYRIGCIDLETNSMTSLVIAEDELDDKGGFQKDFRSAIIKMCDDYVLPEYQSKFLNVLLPEQIESLLSGGVPYIDVTYRRTENGIPQWVRSEITPLPGYGSTHKRVIWYVKNISLERAKEERISEQLMKLNTDINQRLDTVLNGISGGFKISHNDSSFSYEHISSGMSEIQGYTPDELMKVSGGTTVGNIYAPDIEKTLKSINEQYKTGKTYSVKYRVVHKNGSLKWILDNGKIVVDESGAVHHYSLIQDITEQEEHAISLQNILTMQNQMVEALSGGIFAYTMPEYKTLIVNKEALRLFGCIKEDFEDFGHIIPKKIFPQEYDDVKAVLRTLHNPGDCVNYSFHTHIDDGSIISVHASTRVFKFDNGQKFVITSMTDITELDSLTKALNHERKQYRDALIANCEFSFQFDITDGTIYSSYTSARGIDIIHELGYSIPASYDTFIKEFIEHMKPEFLNSAMEDKLYSSSLLNSFNNGESNIEIEYYFPTHDAYRRTQILLSHNEQNDHITGILIATDITPVRKEEEMKRTALIEAQDKIRKTNEQLHIALLNEEKYREAILYESEYTFTVDLTHGILHNTFYTKDGTDVLKSIGLNIPIPFNDFIQQWYTTINPIFDDSKNPLLISREYLINKFTDGEKFIETEYKVDGLNDDDIRFFRLSVLMSEETVSKHIIACIFAKDITSIRKRDLETKRAMQDAYEAANRANDAKTDFLANMSHDIRTPMNAIIGMTAIAGTHLDNKERVADCLNKITVAGKHLLGLINEVLDMSKIETGKVDLNTEAFNLSDLVDNLLTMSRPQAAMHNHELIVNIHNIYHEKVIGDSQRIQQVFMNFMGNAIKYTPDGGLIKVSISEKATNRPKIGCYEIVFEDNGIGMSEDYIQHLFEPFSRADDARIKNIQGTGLGMPISHNIVRMMNGSIDVESEIGKGSKFTITIFLELQDVDETISYDDFIDLRVLVADDDEIACKSTCEILDELGMKGEWVTSGYDAVETITKHCGTDDAFFAVIIDWKMPTMDGISTTRAIREQLGDDIPIIIISAYDWSDIELEARAAGANAFISKPLFKSRVAHLFHELMGHENSTPEQSLPDTLAQERFSGKRALLVEDNELNQEIAAEILGMIGLTIEYANNGKEAVDIMSNAPDGYYDVVFMDIQMPIMNGYEATRAIRALPRKYLKRVPIIAMTANAFAEDVQASKNAGMNEHIAKPIDFEQLLQTLNKWIK